MQIRYMACYKHRAPFLVAQSVCQSPVSKSCFNASSTSTVPESAISVPNAASQLLDAATPCFARSSRQFIQLCSSLDKIFHMFHIWQPSTSRMLPLREVKLLVYASSADCRAIWLRIVPIGSRPKELTGNSVRKGSRTSPMGRSTM
jgi:hypothetical protein